METDLGGVVFGPMDIREYEGLSQTQMFIADEFEEALKLISSVGRSKEGLRLERLVESLRDFLRDCLKLMKVSQMRKLLSTL